MSNLRGKAIDNTHLSIEQAEERGFIHRDYIAHCLRWSHVIKRLYEKSAYKDAVILDVGCGREVPLAKMLYSSRLLPRAYIGLDYNKTLERPKALASAKFPIHLHGNVSFPAVDHIPQLVGEHKYVPNVVTCFEVIEHVEPLHAYKMLCGIHSLMSTDGVAFISTPNWDPAVGAAGNHVNEMKHQVVGHMLEMAGFEVVNVYGTFASIKDYQHLLTADMKHLFDRLRDYYDSNYLATVFAPLFPQSSRNALWEVRPANLGFKPEYPSFDAVSTPWTSSEKWAELMDIDNLKAG